MNRLARRLAGFYPGEWRARYGTEFDALLQDRNLTWRDLLDVLTGAFEMRRKTEGENHAMENPATRPRIIDLKSREVPHVYELETSVEYTRQDGSQTLVRHFMREVDFGDSYLTLNHWSRNSEAAQTVIVSGTKGEVAGDFRTDRTEMLILEADGSVRRSEQTVKTSLRYEAVRGELRERHRNEMKSGLSPDEIYRKFLRPETPAEAPAG